LVKKIRESLEGEACNWALNLFLSHIVTTEVSDELIHPDIPSVDLLKQSFYDNEDKGTDLTVELKGEEVKVHRFLLAMHSKTLSAELYGGFMGRANPSITFEQYSDSVVEQFLKTCYGFKPDFTHCDLIQLLDFTNYINALLFTNLVNYHLNGAKLSTEQLFQIVTFNLWTIFPDKKNTLDAIGSNWLTIVEENPSLQEEFIPHWIEYLKTRPFEKR